jgi:hypothetical protein
VDERWDAGVGAGGGQPGSIARARCSVAVVQPCEIRVSLGVRLDAKQDGLTEEGHNRRRDTVWRRRSTRSTTVGKTRYKRFSDK